MGSFHMSCQKLFIRERFLAIFAGYSLPNLMHGQQVASQVILGAEALVAILAGVAVDAGVLLHVPHQVTAVLHHQSTLRTCKASVVLQNTIIPGQLFVN